MKKPRRNDGEDRPSSSLSGGSRSFDYSEEDATAITADFVNDEDSDSGDDDDEDNHDPGEADVKDENTDREIGELGGEYRDEGKANYRGQAAGKATPDNDDRR